MPMSIPIHASSPTWPGFHCLLFYPSTHHPSTCLPTCLLTSSLHPGLLSPHPNCPLLFLVFFYPSICSCTLSHIHPPAFTVYHPPPTTHHPPFTVHPSILHLAIFVFTLTPDHLSTPSFFQPATFPSYHLSVRPHVPHAQYCIPPLCKPLAYSVFSDESHLPCFCWFVYALHQLPVSYSNLTVELIRTLEGFWGGYSRPV